MKKDISEILLRTDTDKNDASRNPYNGHSYGESYQQVFNDFNNEDKLNILEIGLHAGSSLVAWKEYFENSKIYGIDIIDIISQEHKKEEFTYIFKDIKDNEVLEILKDVNFDIIIDDGSHDLNDQIFVIENYIQKLNINGYLLIEDLQRPEWFEILESKVDKNICEVFRYDTRHKYGRYDDLIIAIKRIK